MLTPNEIKMFNTHFKITLRKIVLIRVYTVYMNTIKCLNLPRLSFSVIS